MSFYEGKGMWKGKTAMPADSWWICRCPVSVTSHILQLIAIALWCTSGHCSQVVLDLVQWELQPRSMVRSNLLKESCALWCWWSTHLRLASLSVQPCAVADRQALTACPTASRAAQGIMRWARELLTVGAILCGRRTNHDKSTQDALLSSTLSTLSKLFRVWFSTGTTQKDALTPLVFILSFCGTSS